MSNMEAFNTITSQIQKKFAEDSMKAIKEALAQPEQEPVAFINVEQRKLEWAKYMTWDTPTVVNLPKIPLYATPPQRTWVDRNEVLEEVAKQFDKMPFGDTAASFAIFVRNMKT